MLWYYVNFDTGVSRITSSINVHCPPVATLGNCNTECFGGEEFSNGNIKH